VDISSSLPRSPLLTLSPEILDSGTERRGHRSDPTDAFRMHGMRRPTE
jgi:hypothetical protein